MKLIDFTIQELFGDDAKLTFLVGAGSSVDAPSCLAAGRKMMDAIINYTCADSEKDKILQLQELRFEQLIEIIRDQIDPELKVIDYYGQCDNPNLQHFFLAKMIKKGHFVMTTNFDNLIECALLQSNVPKKEIVPVITERDFKNFENPHKLFQKGKKTVYKIHGSTKNIITKTSTKDSLIATIQAFGSNKEGLNIFQVQPFQRKLFDNISNGRSLVVMGYSGSDDFDVVPTLMVLKNIKNLIWIKNTYDDGGKEQIYEVTSPMTNTTDKVNQILSDIKRTNYAEHVYRVNVNTTRLIEQLLDVASKVNNETFLVTPLDWLKINVPMPSKFTKFSIPSIIYFNFNMFEDSMKCLEVMLMLTEKIEDQKWKASVLNNIGMVYNAQGSYPEALKGYEQALKIAEQQGYFSVKTRCINNIGAVYRVMRSYPEALKRYEQALKIAEQQGNLSEKAISLNEIGLIYEAMGNYPEALKIYEQALKIAEQLGNVSRKASRLNNIGAVYESMGNHPEALKRYEQAFKITEQLGNESHKGILLNNIAMIYAIQGNYPQALEWYEKALSIAEQFGEFSKKAICLNNIGSIYFEKKNYPEALKKFEQALKIAEQLGDMSGKAIRLNNIGSIYQDQWNYPEALKKFEQALKISEQLGDLSLKATALNNIASIHYTQKKYLKALALFEKSLAIEIQLGNKPKQAVRYDWIGVIYNTMNRKDEALNSLERCLKIYHELGLENHAKEVQSAINKVTCKK